MRKCKQLVLYYKQMDSWIVPMTARKPSGDGSNEEEKRRKSDLRGLVQGTMLKW
ncbi:MULTISPECIES: hypothetical protein [Heyndrickxia]|uniref:hypothetical protein n=1 Tax=Heyndrickxia TaxID=2837504 RepID=UPI0013D65326|nr:hypothetical protein [Heyndrickxia shackletonii]NEY98679.1 hypothetical protein [Heyndrickxia shackletonii]